MTDYSTLEYPNMNAWPALRAGRPPGFDEIIKARALRVAKPGTKRELAVAAYLRDDASQYTTTEVAAALQAVLGGDFNPILNVANADLDRDMKAAKVIKTKVSGGTSYKLELVEPYATQANNFLATMKHLVSHEGLSAGEVADQLPRDHIEAPAVVNARQRSIWQMVNTVKQTISAANGQQMLRTIKTKNCDSLRRN